MGLMELKKSNPVQWSSLSTEPGPASLKGTKIGISTPPRSHTKAAGLQHRKHTRWKPPDFDSFKVNYDGATFNEQGKAGIVVVIRNSEGAVMASLSQQVPLPATVAQVEALAARRAIEFALEVGITQAIIKGDSDIIFKDLTSPGLSLALHGYLIHDVKQLANAFTNISFVAQGIL